MAKLTAPSFDTGPRKVLSDELHALHRRAGWPSVRELARSLGSGVASPSRIHDAFQKPRLPDWGLLEVLVAELARRVPKADEATEIERFHSLWEAAAETPLPSLTAPKGVPEQNDEVTLKSASASTARLDKLHKDLGCNEDLQGSTSRKGERLLDQVGNLNERLDSLRGQVERLQRSGDFDGASKLLYGEIPALERKLKATIEAAQAERRSHESLVDGFRSGQIYY